MHEHEDHQERDRRSGGVVRCKVTHLLGVGVAFARAGDFGMPSSDHAMGGVAVLNEDGARGGEHVS